INLSTLQDFLACPACGGAVSQYPSSYRCSGCAREFPIRFGIPDFRLAPDPYISIDDEVAKIERLNIEGKSFGDLVRAYYSITPENPPALHTRYIASMDAAIARGAGILSKLMTRFPATGTRALLDVGCGTAGMTIAGTRTFDTVIGADVALRWLVMGQQRIREAGVSAILVAANAEHLPFRSKVFDAAAADAVVEHVADSSKMRDEVIRVLEPGGAWFFVTNNRYSVLPEPHVRIWGFGLLPRGVMERVAWKLRKTPYKATLHSRAKLHELFDSVGEVMLPYYESGELGPQNETIRLTWEKLRRVELVRRLAGAVVPQYFIAGRRSTDS
ncbi:MAG: methyltransferase domain-containing protein, partial [Thermoanaerobaculia bacterium]